MKQSISHQHKQQLEQIKRDLTTIGFRESNFIKVELLFYQAMTVAREYGNDENENHLLAALKQLQAREYQQTKIVFKKSTQREKAIRSFVNRVKVVLTAGIKNEFFQPQLS